MTAEGRLARGKLNFESDKLLNNSETLDYLKTLIKEEPKMILGKPKEAKHGKSKSR